MNEFPTLTLITSLLLLFISGFLNFISSLYSEIDLFKIDLVRAKKKGKKIQKLTFILKNSNLLFTVVCFFQVFLNVFISIILYNRLEKFFAELKWLNEYVFILGISLVIALFTEIFARYLATRPNRGKLVMNNFFVDLAYLLTRPFFFLQIIAKPRKKLFINSEQDIARFINNLTVEKVLEKKEARLVRSALNFDELSTSQVFTPHRKVVFLHEDMSQEEVKKIHLKHFFTRYPVYNQKKEVSGIFSTKIFYRQLLKNERLTWQDCIKRKFLYFSSQDKLDTVLARLKTTGSRLAIVRRGKKVLGIVTLDDVLDTLIGKKKPLSLPRSFN